jgi:type I restriction enzyme S subunit
MTADKPSRLVPKLRFPEFRDTLGWSKRQLGEILTPILREREKPAVPYTGLGIRSHGRGTFQKELEQPEKTSMERLYEVDSNDLIVNITFAWEGAIAIVRPEDSGALVSHRFPTYQFDQNAVLPEFFRYPILNKQFIYNLGVISPGGAGRNRVLNKADFLKIELALPEVAEQQKIADCLGSLDDLIATEGRKLEALRQHKQGLMQQLFPQPGESRPRLRFPEFRNAVEWQRCALGEIAEISKGKGISKSDVVEGGRTPCVRYGELYNSYGEIIEIVKSRTNLPASDLVLSNAGDVIIPASGETKEDIATCACVVDDGVALGSDLNVIRSPVDGRFLSYYLNGSRRRELAKVAQGDTVAHLYPTQLSRLEVYIPDAKAEQQRIADCLSSLDARLAVQVQKQNALETHKQGLLQQLFPSLEG